MLPCPFCGKQPVINRHAAPPKEAVDAGLKPGAWAEVQCKSEECANRIVKTHRCGTEADAIKVWESGRG